jgi:molybdopterin molybdotransferase
MITVVQARNTVIEHLPGTSSEAVELELSLGRILAEELKATCDVPPFDRAAMDGFALRARDVEGAPVDLELVGEVRAGQGEPGSIETGQCKAIMTGAALPRGADAVQPVEKARQHGDRVTILTAVRAGAHFAPRAAEASEGEVVLEPGRLIGPAEIAVMATFGVRRPLLIRRPSVAVLSTGDELVEVSEEPGPGQIRNSNALSLASQVRSLGIEPESLGIARDNRDDLRERIGAGLTRDVLVLTGGVSMGAYDLVPPVLQELGLEILFTRVAMRPGKPTLFARRGRTLVFGLPGNPVSTFVAFENFVRPALGRLCGFRSPELPRVRGELQGDMRQTPGRTAYLPACSRYADGRWAVTPLPSKGSADIIGFSRADSLVIFPSELSQLRPGDSVEALLLPDHHLRRATEGE